MPVLLELRLEFEPEIRSAVRFVADVGPVEIEFVLIV